MTTPDARPSLPASAHVGRIALQVADLGRSQQFYEDVIGFRRVALTEADGRRVARLSAAASDDWLLELQEKPGVRRVPRRGLLGLYHFAVLLPERADLGRFVTHATRAGVSMGAADHLVSEALYLTDPDGLQIEVYVDRPRASWPVRNGAIQLATLPLNFDPIVASAAGTSWDGLPPGTRIGHVHFYVGDIPAAHAFYVAALGFDPVVSDFPGALFVSAGGYHHHVGLNTWAAGAPTATDDDARLLFWELVLPGAEDVGAVVSRLTRGGHHVASPGSSISATDPWGIVVHLRDGS